MSVQGTFSLALTGDSMIMRSVATSGDPDTRNLIELIQRADVAFTNLEVLPNDFCGYPSQESGGTHLAAPARVLDDLIAMGFDLFACATNHALDYSIAGLLVMIEELRSRDAAYAGVGTNLAEARMPVYVEHAAGTISMTACTSTFSRGQQAGAQRADFRGRPGPNPLRHETVYEIPGEHIETLRTIAEALGIERQRLERIDMGFAHPPDDPEIYPFFDQQFRALPTEGGQCPEPRVVTTPHERDLEDLSAWAREAKARSDHVLVSMHGHESDGERHLPAKFLRTFARRMIDDGADIVVGHGPHLLRGMELYQGKPIFYSLGNFIAQNDLVYKLPADSYDRFRTEPTGRPGDVFRTRSKDSTAGFPAYSEYWQSIMPICRFDRGALATIELVPLTLGFGEPVYQRGRPRLASGEEATEILEHFADLSANYAVEIAIADNRGFVNLDA